MKYQQKHNDLELMGAHTDLDEACIELRYEMAENLFHVNNRYCDEKYTVFYDVFWGFPASEKYDPCISPIIPLAIRMIMLGYETVGASIRIKKAVLWDLIALRKKLLTAMSALP